MHLVSVSGSLSEAHTGGALMHNYSKHRKKREYRKKVAGNVSAPGREEAAETSPPITNRGVEITGQEVKTFHLDWLTCTVFVDREKALQLYDEHFKDVLGELVDTEHGALGFKHCFTALGGFRLNTDPANGRGQWSTFFFPGEACSAIPPEYFKDFHYQVMAKGHRFQVSRLDTAYNGVPFTPRQFYTAVQEKKVRSLAKRDTLKWVSSPYQMREDGSGVGCDTAYLGSRQSERFLRVYNLHGYTRLEMEYKGARANMVFHRLAASPPEKWHEIALGHLRDYIDVMRPWWKRFVGEVGRAYAKIVDIKQAALERVVEWLEKQVAPSLSVINDTCGLEVLLWMIDIGRERRSQKHNVLVESFIPV
jgi:hypothetical protein